MMTFNYVFQFLIFFIINFSNIFLSWILFSSSCLQYFIRYNIHYFIHLKIYHSSANHKKSSLKVVLLCLKILCILSYMRSSTPVHQFILVFSESVVYKAHHIFTTTAHMFPQQSSFTYQKYIFGQSAHWPCPPALSAESGQDSRENESLQVLIYGLDTLRQRDRRRLR